MKISLSLNIYSKYSLVESLKRVSRLGYDGVELWGARPHAWPYDLDTKSIKETTDALSDNGLKLVSYNPMQLNSYVNIASETLKIRNESLDYLKRSADIANAMSASYLSIVPGYAIYGQSNESGWNIMQESMTALLTHVSTTPLRILLEVANHLDSNLINRISDAARMLSSVSDQAGMAISTNIMHSNKEVLADSIDISKGVHVLYRINDSMGSSDKFIIPGEGNIDFDLFLERLRKNSYKGFLSVYLGSEYSTNPDVAAKRSIDFIKRKENVLVKVKK